MEKKGEIIILYIIYYIILYYLSFYFKPGIPIAWHASMCEWKGLSDEHSHRPPPLLPPSWECLHVLTPTEIRGCGGYQQHTMTLAH